MVARNHVGQQNSGADMAQINAANKIIALDGDGVLLDYSSAYAQAWERAFGERVVLQNPQAYWPIERWGLRQLNGDELARFRDQMDEAFWSTIPAMDGALDACLRLQALGYRLICVTALAKRYAAARYQNLVDLGFPIEEVITTDADAYQSNPKAAVLNALAPIAFVDDYAPYMVGIAPTIHRALIARGPDGSPNTGVALDSADSLHADLTAFVAYWSEHG
jgi:phosphoglycolate phosphatase-like HAD superfamily hydrolase